MSSYNSGGPLTNMPGGFPFGFAIRNVPLVQVQPGVVFWVTNSANLLPNQHAGSNNNHGTFLDPFATVAYALTQCVSGRGDVIMVGAGHAETIADAAVTYSITTAGVAIIGLGVGSSRPTFTFTTAGTSTIGIGAANVSWQNCLFIADVNNIGSVFTQIAASVATDFCIDNCEFRDTSSALNFTTVFTGISTANSCDGFTFTRNLISSLGTTAATTAIILSQTQNRVTINDNDGVWAILNDTAAMLATGANSLTNFQFNRNRIMRPNTSTASGLAISTSGTAWTGQCCDNRIWGLDNTAQIWINTGTKLGFNQNFCPIASVADKSGSVNPAAV